MPNTKEFLLSNEVRKANYHTYKRIYYYAAIMKEVYKSFLLPKVDLVYFKTSILVFVFDISHQMSSNSFYGYINNESSLFQAHDQSRRAKKEGEQRKSDRDKNGRKSEGDGLSQVERTLAYPTYTGRVNLSYNSLQTRGAEPFTGETKSWLGQRGSPPSRLRQTANLNLYHVTKFSFTFLSLFCSSTKNDYFHIIILHKICLGLFLLAYFLF